MCSVTSCAYYQTICQSVRENLLLIKWQQCKDLLKPMQLIDSAAVMLQLLGYICGIDRWQHLRSPKNAVDAFIQCNGDLLPSIKKLLQVMATLPVTTCNSECAFSSLRRIKTYLRSTIGVERFNGLAVLNIHRHSCIPRTGTRQTLWKTSSLAISVDVTFVFVMLTV